MRILAQNFKRKNTILPLHSFKLRIVRTFSLNNKEKTKFQRFVHGVKLGFKLSLLPDRVAKLHNHPFTRIFRVIGGISFILLIGGGVTRGSLLFYVILSLAILQLIYIMIIATIKFCYYIYLLINGKLQVRNSP